MSARNGEGKGLGTGSVSKDKHNNLCSDPQKSHTKKRKLDMFECA